MLRTNHHRIGALLFWAGIMAVGASAQKPGNQSGSDLAARDGAKAGRPHMASAGPLGDSLERVFAHPPVPAKPWVFWSWMQAGISPDGMQGMKRLQDSNFASGVIPNGANHYFHKDKAWLNLAKGWVDYTRRCQWLLQQGQQVAAITSIEGIALEKDLIGTESDFLWAGAAAQNDTASEIIIPALHKATNIAYTHHTVPGLDVYFISNQLNKPRIINFSLLIAGKKPELWDAVTGEVTLPEQWSQHGNRTVLPVRLEASGSLFVVFRKPARKEGVISDDEEDRGVTDNMVELPTIKNLPVSWTLRFNTTMGGPAGEVRFDSLQDWSVNADAAIRYYSGTAAYTQTFGWNDTDRTDMGQDSLNQTVSGGPPRLWLDLGQVADIARVRLNGVDCGVAWTPPYRVEITRAIQPGNNVLTIEVTNTRVNRLTGDHLLPENKRVTRTTTPYHLNGKLLEAGLLGPVTIKGEDR